jgi:hypothetical protein
VNVGAVSAFIQATCPVVGVDGDLLYRQTSGSYSFSLARFGYFECRGLVPAMIP